MEGDTPLPRHLVSHQAEGYGNSCGAGSRSGRSAQRVLSEHPLALSVTLRPFLGQSSVGVRRLGPPTPPSSQMPLPRLSGGLPPLPLGAGVRLVLEKP